MIRRGKTEGWLQSSPADLPNWAALNGASFQNVRVTNIEGKGAALIATQTGSAADLNPLLTVPRDLVLSRETVQDLARSDTQLREVLDAVGDFSQTSRGSILIFLLMQLTRSRPALTRSVGVSTVFADYCKFLPLELLPTFWSDEEKELVRGLSLEPALEAKLSSLSREFEHFRSATSDIAWCKEVWWDDSCTLDDWKQIDAMYRSRALEYPGIGDAVVPCIDMANHASGDGTGALYESDSNGQALLLLRDGKTVEAGDEITITYGDEKGACEMIFSYGFIEQNLDDARDIFLSLDIPTDDPLRLPKKHLAGSAPGVRIFSKPSGISWESPYVWLVCVNEEDGLEFHLAQTVDGGRELQVTWQGQRLEDLAGCPAYSNPVQ